MNLRNSKSMIGPAKVRSIPPTEFVPSVFIRGSGMRAMNPTDPRPSINAPNTNAIEYPNASSLGAANPFHQSTNIAAPRPVIIAATVAIFIRRPKISPAWSTGMMSRNQPFQPVTTNAVATPRIPTKASNKITAP